MKTKTHHTPTPWRYNPSQGLDREIIRHFGEVVGKIEKREDAEFIVRAVNSHEALLEAAKEFMIDSECYCLDAQESLGRNPCAYCRMKVVIAQVEGK
jgi:hypothetical protein